MARKVFFSFHYKNDVYRANVVRNSWVTKDRVDAGFVDKAEFEKIKLKGNRAVEQWIDGQLKGTSVTVVLIGRETLSRYFVQYEIMQSFNKGNPIIGVGVGNVRDMHTGLTSTSQSIYTRVGTVNGRPVNFSDLMSNYYDYINEDGYSNLAEWIENARVKINR